MKVRNVQRHGEEKVELQMTPMIDIVFQLLIFFIMTFKIVAPEGDFNIRMPQVAVSDDLPDDTQHLQIKVTLGADPDGRLTSIRMGERTLSGFSELHNEVRQIVGEKTGPGSSEESPEVELDCAFQLKFDYVMQAITAVSGYVDPDTRGIVKIIDTIKFTSPRDEPPS